MAPVDPTVLLNTIVYLLDHNGGLKNDRVVRQFLTLMKLAEKLVNKSIYLQILSHTRSEDILQMFLKNAGHEILFKWLRHFHSEHNHTFVLDILKILGELPLNYIQLSQNDIDELHRIVVELASNIESGEEKDIRESAQHLYDIWSTQGIFQRRYSSSDIDQRRFSQSSSTSTNLIEQHPSLTSNECHQNLEGSFFLSINNSPQTCSSSSPSSPPLPVLQINAKKMATTATLTAVSSAGTTSSSNHNNSTDTNKRKLEENLGGSTSRKPTQRRLSAGSPQTDSTNMKPSIDLDDSDGLNRNNALNRTSATFRIPKIGRTNSNVSSPTSDGSESSLTNNSSNKPPAPLNRQSSDELNAQQGKRKFSLSQYKEHKRLKSNEIQGNTSGDTDMRLNHMENSKSSPPMTIEEDGANVSDNQQTVVSPKSDETSKEIVMKSNLSEPGVKKVIKKKVIWADEKNQTLVQTSFFEVDDSELSDMHIFARTCAANISIAQLEKVMERDLRKRRGLQELNSNDNDEKQYSTPLPKLIKILLPETIQIPQVISQERFIQDEREKTVLQALFIRSFLPDSPGEPDGDLLATNNNNNLERTEPKLIPLEDDTSSSISSKVTSGISSSSNNFPANNVLLTPTTITTTTTTSTPTTTTTTNNTATPSLSSFSFSNLSPEVAQILAQAKGNATSATANQLSTTATPTNPLINGSTTISSVTPTIANPTITTTPNLPAPPHLLSALFNVTRPPGHETQNVPPTNPIANLLPNLPLNFNLPPPPPTAFPLHMIASALSLGIPPPPTAASSLFQTATQSTFTSPGNLANALVNAVVPPAASATTTSVNSSLNSKPPSVRFVSAIGQQQMRPNLSNNHEHSMSSSRENSREHHFRRGGGPGNHNNRREYYQNRNNNNNNNHNNNNRNIFS